jgi:RHS repeat-associated protein
VDDKVLLLRTADGRHLPLPPLAPGEEHFDRKEKLTLRRDEHGYSVRAADGLEFHFGPGSHYQRLVRMQDALGNRISLHYNPAGLLAQMVDSGGRVFAIHHDRHGQIERIEGPHPENPEQRVILARYQYDDRGNLVTVWNALEQAMRFEYRDHLLAREVNRNGLSFYFEYDGNDEHARCIRTWGDDGIYDHKLRYQPGVTEVENSLGQKTVYHHRDGLVWKTVDALGNVTLSERNKFSEVVAETDALGQVTESVRDQRGNLVEEKSPDGSVVKIAYDAQDRPVALQGPAGGEWKWRYDEQGRLVERADALGQRTRFVWAGPRLEAVADPSGHSTVLGYDRAGNLVLLRTPDGAETGWEYDGLGRCVQARDPAGNIERRQVDALGRIARVYEPDGNVRELRYDGEDNVVAVKDQQYDVQFAYGGMGRLVKRTQAGTTVHFSYDTEEQLVAIHNEAGAVYRFVLGPTGEVNEEYGFDGLCRKYQRDKAGRVHRVLRPAGLATEYKYDKADRVVGVKHLDAAGAPVGEEKYTYRTDGELVAAGNGTAVVKLERDILGRVVNEVQGADTVASAYGPLGLRMRMRTSRGHALEIERNVVGDVIAMRAGGGPVVSSGSEPKKDTESSPWEVRFTRDQLGLELERHLPGGVRSRWERDKLGRPVKHEIWSGRKLVGAKSYVWEPNDRLKMIVDALRGPVQFSHDGLGNLTAAAYEDGKVDLRMPDAVGNLFRTNERRDRKYGPAGQLLESYAPEGVTRYSYDSEGNLAQKLLPDGRCWKYEWNAAGMLAKVVRPDGKEVEFGYDALGRRVWKKYGAKTTKWIWDGNVPVHEWVEVDPAMLAAAPSPAPEAQAAATEAAIRQRQAVLSEQPAQGPPPSAPLTQRSGESGNEASSGSLAPRSGERVGERGDAPFTTWIFEPEGFAPIAKLSGNEQHSIITDHLGTPTAMLDAAGKTLWSADISIYGELRNIVGDRQACPFRWPGQYEDAETGLYYNRFRYYDPEAGEYVSQDPLGVTGGLAPHGYVRDPSTWVDPLALAGAPCTPPKAIKHGPLNPGPLPQGVADTFRSGTYTARTVSRRTTLYRVYGGNAKQVGPYWTRTKPSGPTQSVIDSALKPQWGNTATRVAKIRVPAGTTIYEGVAAAQGGLVGGGSQVFIPNVNPAWLVP